MNTRAKRRVVFMCHEEDRIDCEGMAAWLACSFELAGMVVIREDRGIRMRRARREIRRVGLLRFLDVLAFRVYYRLRHWQAHLAWVSGQVERLRMRYVVDLSNTPRLVTDDPNTEEVARFIQRHKPDLVLARCKILLKPAIYDIARFGTFVLHPGVCPQYRNAHGCFWALVNRDLAHVGMTLLRIDAGIDTGPIYLYASYAFDERSESHITIQYRVVLENLPAIEKTLNSICEGTAHPICVGRDVPSANWGQPWLSAYLKWKRAAWEGRYA